ncbi:hypothetical protein ACLOJK_024684 [Asimina triloba]
MASERAASKASVSISSTYHRKKYKKESVPADSIKDSSMAKEELVESHAEIQNLRNDTSQLEAMTVQELRKMMRSVGLPIKGIKQDLVSSLKHFLANHKDGESSLALGEESPSGMECTSPRHARRKTKAESLHTGNGSQNLNTDSEVPGTNQMEDKGKQLVSTSLEVNCRQVVTEKKILVKTNKKKHSRAKGNVSSQTDAVTANGVDLAANEPWTVLTHKKPQPGWVAYNPRTMRPQPLADDTKFMKLMSWNVNGLRALLKLEGFSALQLAQRENFDVLCLQETKLQEKDIEDIKQHLLDGYDNSFWTCSIAKRGYSGTAVISRIKPLSVKYGLGIQDHDSEGRLVTVEFDSFYLLCCYVPNSGDGNYYHLLLTVKAADCLAVKDPVFGVLFPSFEGIYGSHCGRRGRVTSYSRSSQSHEWDLEKSKPVILTGDLNCAHQEIDIFDPAKSKRLEFFIGNRRNAGFTIEERESFQANFLSRGFVDSFRKQQPDVVGYTYWGYRHNCRATNKGWRLDYFLVSESLADMKVNSSLVLEELKKGKEMKRDAKYESEYYKNVKSSIGDVRRKAQDPPEDQRGLYTAAFFLFPDLSLSTQAAAGVSVDDRQKPQYANSDVLHLRNSLRVLHCSLRLLCHLFHLYDHHPIELIESLLNLKTHVILENRQVVVSKRIHESRGLNLEKHMTSGNITAKISSGIMRPTDSVAAAIPLHAGSQIVTAQALPTKKRSWKDVENIEKLPLYSHLQDKMKEIMERPQYEVSFMNQDGIYTEVMDGISKYVELLGQGPNLTKQKLHNITMETGTQELPQNLVVQDEYVKGLGRAPKPTKQKLPNITMDRETQELPQNLAVQECIKVPDGISMNVKGLGQGLKPKQNLHNIVSKRKTQELPENFVVQDEFIEVRDGKSKYMKELGRGPKSKQKLHNIAVERETQELPQNLVVQDECIEVTDGLSGHVTRPARGPMPTKQKLQIISVGRETEDLPQDLVVQDECIESRQRENEEQAKQAADVPTSLAKHLEEMRMRQAQLEQQAKLLEEMLIFEAQLKKQAKRLEEMSNSQAQLKASFQRLSQ